MPRYNERKNNLAAVFVAAGVLAQALGLLLAATTFATDTQIGAKVCGSNPDAAIIAISQPVDDSIVNQPTVTIRGSVASTSQVIVEIDDIYDSTLAIPNNETAFMIDVSLMEGTHTITLRATEVCGGADGTDEVVVTYRPAVEPSTGGQTPTTIEGQALGTGVSVVGATDTPAVEQSTAQPLEQVPVIGPAAEALADFASMIGLEATVAAGEATVAVGVARVGLTVAAVTSVVMAGTLAPLAAHAVPGIADVFDVTSHRSMMYLGWCIHGVGVLAMALAYFI